MPPTCVYRSRDSSTAGGRHVGSVLREAMVCVRQVGADGCKLDRGHFPTERPPSEVSISHYETWTPPGEEGHDGSLRWKPALNALTLTFEGRIIPTNNN